MFDVQVDGLKGLMLAMNEAGDLPADVRKEMVDAQAEVVEKSLVYHAGTMPKGPYYRGGVARSVTRRKARATKNGATASIVFKGTQHGNRLAEIAFINEFGKSSQPARPFIRTANDKAADPAADAAHDVLDKYLSKKGL